MKKKRWLGLLLAVAMLLTLIPLFATAAPESEGVLVFTEGGVMGSSSTVEHVIYSYYSDFVPTDDEWAEQNGISYSVDTNTLELNNVDLSSTTYHLYIVRMGEDFKIKVSGNCKINGQIFNQASYSNITIYSQNNGSLELDALQITNTYVNDPALFQIENNVTVTLNVGFMFAVKNIGDTEYTPENLITYKGTVTPELVFNDAGSGIMGSDHFYYNQNKLVFSPYHADGEPHIFVDGECIYCGAVEETDEPDDPVIPDEPDTPSDSTKLPCWVNGIVKGCDGKWAMYKKGVVDTSFTGLACNCYGWWYVEDGYVNFDVNGLYQNDLGWWYVKNSKVDFCFTGIASNQYGTWYVKNGKVDFTKTGKVKFNGKNYIVLLGRVIL